ncbi:MAG: NTP transferase domain-containing protein [Lachnospiraceae bacterium]|nr:NTP transferase domain-containing protein [Lachnospiraceae bacterium]
MESVKRAIIMAAGMGKRMMPLTVDTPKPLIKVHGTPMIETIIIGLRQNNIAEIYIVAGYLHDKFEYLVMKYPGVVIIKNPYYEVSNNISSLYVARDYLENAMILDGDQIINNLEVLKADFEKSGYNCVWTEFETKEWLLTVVDDHVVQCRREGGRRGWQLYSISRWTAEDGRKLKRHLEIEFDERKNRQIYWDDIALFCYPEEYDLGIMPMGAEDVIEIDNLKELAEVDHLYENYAGE